MQTLPIALCLVVVASNVALAADGMFKTRKLPDDAVVAPPVGIESKPLPDDLIRAPEHMLPGTHTLSLEVAKTLPKVSHKGWQGGSVSCHKINEFPPFAGHVGWGEIEYGDSPCHAMVLQLAVLFDNGPLAEIPNETIDRVVLTYDEAPGLICGALVVGEKSTCWQNGEGEPEPKPDGCAVVRVPIVDWAQTEPPGLIPFSTGSPAVQRIGTREWDVTEAFRWQTVSGAVPLGVNPGFGFLFTGSITALAELEGEDDTICTSLISNIKANVTYTVPEPAGAPPVVR